VVRIDVVCIVVRIDVLLLLGIAVVVVRRGVDGVVVTLLFDVLGDDDHRVIVLCALPKDGISDYILRNYQSIHVSSPQIQSASNVFKKRQSMTVLEYTNQSIFKDHY
jgi:hypothetical protein